MSANQHEVPCPICGHHGAKVLPRYKRAHLVRCERCDQIFAGRRPTDAELEGNYGAYPRVDSVSPITRVRYQELLDGFEAYRGTNRILDMGCGLGFFLEEAENKGWEAYGTEFETRAVEINQRKGLRCVPAPIDTESFGDTRFDVITAFEVVEHLRDPGAEAELIARLLRPGGLFYCTTPNFSSLSRRALRDQWAVIEYPEHLIYFTPSTLRGWLERFGFGTVGVTTTGFTMSRRQECADAQNWNDSPAGQERLRATVESSRVLRAVKATVNSALGAVGAGDTIKAHFELSVPPSPALAAQECLEREQSP